MTAQGRRTKAANQVAVTKPPQVTIVVSFRERWRFTAQTVESILANTDGEFALWVLDSGMPKEVRTALEPRRAAGEIAIVPVAKDRQPNEQRATIIDRLESPFVVFIDNDVVVRPHWLERMIACAEETGAGIVCPLYLWGERPDSDLIHMAGGDLTLVETPHGSRMTESHRHVGKTVWQVPEDLHRQPCGFGEFHCLFMRRELYSADGMFDPGIVTIHEHIHASMLARQLGFETWFEPAAQVAYLAFAPWQVAELADLRARWDFDEAERSLEGFARRWKVVDDDDYREPTRQFLRVHAGHTDLLDPRPGMAVNRERVTQRRDLEQTLGGLQSQALEIGYDIQDVRKLLQAYRIAAGLLDGLYRPCGRPFINHLTGTASVLLFYGCAIPHVLAGLLHAALTHGPRPVADRVLGELGGAHTVAEGVAKLVRRYSDRGKLLDSIDLSSGSLDALPVETASLMLIDAANEVDMYLSLEVPMTGRADVLSESRMANLDRLLPAVGLPGLAATVRQLHGQQASWPGLEFVPGLKASIRFKDLTAPAASKAAPQPMVARPGLAPTPQH